MTTPTPDREALLALADRREARAMRKWNAATICPRGLKRVCRLRRDADRLRALAGDRP